MKKVTVQFVNHTDDDFYSSQSILVDGKCLFTVHDVTEPEDAIIGRDIPSAAGVLDCILAVAGKEVVQLPDLDVPDSDEYYKLCE